MNDVIILHLSDLHFDATGARPFKLYEALLSDIKKELKFAKNLVIVVTGDLVNRADYTCKELVLSFFITLKDIIVNQLEIKVHGVLFVPGNHDRKRTYSTSVLGNANVDLDDEYFETFKSFFQNSYREYHLLIKEILALFELHYDEKFTYGSEEILVDGKYFRFIRLDTAWTAQDDSSRRRLRIGQFQIEEIQRQYKKQQSMRKNNEKDEVTFVLAHHPLNWLSGLEEDLIRNFLIGQRGIGADICLCGHTHTRDVVNWSNNRHSLTTLSTGIGWPDAFDSEHSDLHAYAMYVLHLDLNAIDIYVRSTNDGGTFVPDYRIYTSEENRKNNKIVLPIKSTQIQSYITLGSINKRSPKVCFLTNDFLEDIRKFVFAMGCFRQFAIETIEGHVRMLNSILTGYENGRLSNEDQYEINENFHSFLQSICVLLAEEILGNYVFEKGDKIRFHFRYCRNPKETHEELEYVSLCLSYWPNVSEEEKTLSDIKWGQLLQDSYMAKRPLVYSANPENCTKTTEWLDFITIIPFFSENMFPIDIQHIQETRPYLTFGASISSDKFRKILYCLDYYRFDKILTALIRRYISKIPVDISKFVEYMNQKFESKFVEEQDDIK